MISVGLLCGFAVAALAIAYIVLTPPRYYSSTEVLLDPRGLQVMKNDVAPRSETNDSAFAVIESEARVVQSEPVLQAVVERLKLEDDTEFTGRPSLMGWALKFVLPETDPEPARMRALRSLQRIIDVRRAVRSYVIVITARSEDALKAARIANAIAEVYIERQLAGRSDTAERASASLTSRLHQLADQVRAAEQNVEQFRASKDLIGAGGRLVTDQQLSDLNSQLRAARTKTAESAARVEQLEILVKTATNEYGAIAEAVGSQTIATLRGQYAEVVRQQSTSDALLGPRHPAAIDLGEQRKRYEQMIRDEIQRVIQSARNDYSRAKSSEQALAAELDDLKKNAVTSGESMVKLRELERVAETNRQIYEAFLIRAKELGEQSGVASTNVRVISTALPPDRPAGPRGSMIALAALGGVVLGAGGVWLRRRRTA